MEKTVSFNVREIEDRDINLIADYWYLSDKDLLLAMGVDLKKMPTREAFSKMLEQQINTPVNEKAAYALIWEVNNQPVGHSNINKITFEKEAYMHLHLWVPGFRKKGLGTQLILRSLPFYFNNFKLKQLICEPRATNQAPNKVLEKVGFTFEKKYVTTPGSINFEQEVNRWIITNSRFKEITNNPE